MTGAMIPAGADCVIRQEDTDWGETTVRILRGVPAGSNFCHRGEEYEEGDELLSAGQRVDAAAAAVVAGAGILRLPVHRQVRAAVISTGDELRQPGQPLAHGTIYDSNAAYLAARLRQLGVSIRNTISVGDNISGIAAALDCCADCDLILTTGGVSVGEKDLLEAALESLGATVLFHGIVLKPGMPTLLARRGRTKILGLSGNPFSAAVPLELLLRPMLAKMTGDDSLMLRRTYAPAAGDFDRVGPARRFLRAHFDGRAVTIPTAQSNGQMRAMIGCNCLIDLPGGSGGVRCGDRLEILLL